MDWTSNVAVHESASPAFTRERIVEALRQGGLDPTLLYAGLGQSLRWIQLHEAISPARQDPQCEQIYDEAFAEVAQIAKSNVIHVVSLACGHGRKDTRCLQAIRSSGKTVIYTPADISLEMVLTAHRTASSALRGLQCTPLLCELTRCSVLPAILKNFDPSGAERVILFLGTIHNYRPRDILRSILYPLRAQDHLLLGANLAPAQSYDGTMREILAQYDNLPTRQWLMGALSEVQIFKEDGKLQFYVAEDEIPGVKRIEAAFEFSSAKSLNFFGDEVAFRAGQKLRVFSSRRFTEWQIAEIASQAGLEVLKRWIAPSGEEGLFLCRRGVQE